MMLSMETLPIKPVKKSSSVMFEFMRRRAGRRVRIRVSLEEEIGHLQPIHPHVSGVLTNVCQTPFLQVRKNT